MRGGIGRAAVLGHAVPRYGAHARVNKKFGVTMRILILVAVSATMCRAEEPFPADINRWVPVIVPRDGTDAYSRFETAANNSEYEWAVSVDRGRVVAERGLPKCPSPPIPLSGNEVPGILRLVGCVLHSVRVSDGWLV